MYTMSRQIISNLLSHKFKIQTYLKYVHILSQNLHTIQGQIIKVHIWQILQCQDKLSFKSHHNIQYKCTNTYLGIILYTMSLSPIFYHKFKSTYLKYVHINSTPYTSVLTHILTSILHTMSRQNYLKSFKSQIQIQTYLKYVHILSQNLHITHPNIKGI